MSFPGHSKGQLTKANASRLGRMGVEVRARKRLESPPEQEMVKIADGVFLGVLQWHAIDGSVRRWRIAQGPRANNLRVAAKGKEVICGWDHLFRQMRRHLSIPRRRLV